VDFREDRGRLRDGGAEALTSAVSELHVLRLDLVAQALREPPPRKWPLLAT